MSEKSWRSIMPLGPRLTEGEKSATADTLKVFVGLPEITGHGTFLG